MARFDIYEKAGTRRAIRDGLNGTAFFFGSFWLFAKGLWLEGIAGLAFICFVAFSVMAYAPLAGLGLLLCPALFAWVEGQSLVARRLQRKGWAHVASVEASTSDGALMAFDMRQSAGRAVPPPLPSFLPKGASAFARPKVQGNLKGPAPFGLEGL